MLAKAAGYIPYSIVLLDAQSSAVSAVPAQKKPAQIRRLATKNREQFRVRAAWAGNPPMAELGPESGLRYSPDGFRQPWE